MENNSASFTVRSSNENFIYSRRRDLLQQGFKVTETDEFKVDQRNTVYSFIATVPFADAHKLDRTDDRWAVANSFFQQAEIREQRRGRYAQAANNWTQFDYRRHTLEEYLAIQHDMFTR